MDPASGKVWVTRSEPGASRLAAALSAGGFAAWVGPVLQIEPLNSTPVNYALSQPPWPLASAEMVVVLSEHAVLHAQLLPWQDWVSAGARILAVGATTAEALQRRGVAAMVPREATSEGLLAEYLSSAAVAGRKVLLLAGAGGRDTLRQELTTSGADVAEMALYRRVAVDRLKIPASTIGAICVSSGDGLQAAYRLWQRCSSRDDLPVYAPSARVVKMARGIGWMNAYNCGGAGSAAVLDALKAN